MPTYEFECAHCGPFDAMRSIARRDAPASCPVCEADAMRVIRSAPLLSSLSVATRSAHAVNERAAHEPVRSSAHGAGCGCCSSKIKLPRAVGAQEAPRSAAGRPWMISH